VIIAVTGSNVIVAAAGDDVDRRVVWNGDVEILVRVAKVDDDRISWRRGEHDDVARLRGGLDRCCRVGEAAIAHQQITAVAVLNDLDILQRVDVDAAVHLPMASNRGQS
jgi:hypothetical protein